MASTSSQPARRTSRILALQPRMTVENLVETVMSTQDPAILGAMTNLVRIWASSNKTLPDDFAAKATVSAVRRQPMVYGTVDLERCERTRQRVEAPLTPDHSLNAEPWPTDDLYHLIPLAPPTFAAASRTDHIALSGAEAAVACAQCSGAGALACTRCEGGRITCPSCGGALRTTCRICGGSGSHLGVSGRMIQCRTCSSSGSVKCNRCAQVGVVTCPACQGQGLISCKPCAGFGKILQSWELIETRRADHRRRPLQERLWDADWDEAFEQSDVIAERAYSVDGEQPSIELDPLGPTELHQHVASLLQDALDAHANERRNGLATDRIVAVRVGLRAFYAYDVQIEYDGQAYRVLVAGGGTILPRRLPAVKHGLVAFGAQLVKRYIHALQTDEESGPPKAFIDSVNSGQAHISDDLCLLPQVAARLGSEIEVTEAGYRCYVYDKSGGELPPTIMLDVRFDLNSSDQRMLCVDIDLGEAHRDRFSKLLAACDKLPIGRLAVVDASDGTERLRLVDRRPYGTCDAGQYAGVLQLLADASRRLCKIE